MPKIFSKDCKIKVIEYGPNAPSPVSWNDLKARIQEHLVPAANIFKIVKRAS